MDDHNPNHRPVYEDVAFKTLRIRSFGRRYGPLLSRDGTGKATFDVRTLPNPPKHVRTSQSGLFKPLQEWLFSEPEVVEKADEIIRRIESLLQEAEKEDGVEDDGQPEEGGDQNYGQKSKNEQNSITDVSDTDEDDEDEEDEEEEDEDDESEVDIDIGICCELGRHRSVAVVETLGRRKWPKGWRVVVDHRDVHRQRSEMSKRKGTRGRGRDHIGDTDY